MEKLKLFDYLNSLNHEKNHLLEDGDDQVEKGYPAFIANVAMSLRMDTIMFANEMNERHYIPNRWNYDYYFHGLDRAKRFAKWPKKQKNDNVDVICKYYKVNQSRALEYLAILSEDDVENIKSKMNEGGR